MLQLCSALFCPLPLFSWTIELKYFDSAKVAVYIRVGLLTRRVVFSTYRVIKVETDGTR